MEKFVYYGELYNIYKDLLTKNSQDIFSLYYEENLTLQEIADNLNVSKSYVGNVIKKSEKKLDDLEHSLQIYARKTKVMELSTSDDIKYIKDELKNLYK